MWQVDYTFSGGILSHAVFGGDTDHGDRFAPNGAHNIISASPFLGIQFIFSVIYLYSPSAI